MFSITHAKDQVNWNSQDRVATGSQLAVHFNHVLFVNDQFHLVALDTRLGQKSWEFSGADIERFYVSYPQLVYLTKSDEIGALDFMSGKKLWQRRFKTVEGFSLLGQSGILGVMTEGELVMMYSHDGVDVSKVFLPKLQTKLVAAWNNGLVLGTGADFYTYLLNKNTITATIMISIKLQYLLQHR